MKRGLILLIIVAGFTAMINAQTKGTLSISLTTKSAPIATTGTASTQGTTGNFPMVRGGHGAGRSYAPENILAVWIEDANGKFVKTLIVNAQRYTMFLTAWKNSTSAAGTAFNNVDAITGATNRYHGVRSCLWDGTDYKGKIVADGTYKVCMELTETNSTGNNASFTITKGKTAVVTKPEDKSNFTAITLKWEPGTSALTKN